jgi:hypothetical protein
MLHCGECGDDIDAGWGTRHTTSAASGTASALCIVPWSAAPVLPGNLVASGCGKGYVTESSAASAT